MIHHAKDTDITYMSPIMSHLFVELHSPMGGWLILREVQVGANKSCIALVSIVKSDRYILAGYHFFPRCHIMLIWRSQCARNQSACTLFPQSVEV